MSRSTHLKWFQGYRDFIARLASDAGHIQLFRTSRPLAENMTGGPVRLQMQFSSRAASSELLESLHSLVGSSAFTLLNSDFQRQSLQPSPLVRQIRDLLS